MLDTLDAAAVRRWCRRGLAALRAHQREIDELNVYPVPDGDTGTNLVLTLTSAAEALSATGAETRQAGSGEVAGVEPTALTRAMRRMARGALLGARGNSGVIVSQILRGMADTFATVVAVRGGELARALRTATEAAYGAVARPVEGTVLTVVAAAADAASKITSDDLLAVARAAARAAAEALARTPQQLPALARAGVVDAGGRGLVLLLEALVDALTSTNSTADPTTPATSTAPLPPAVSAPAASAPAPPGSTAPGSAPPGSTAPGSAAPGSTPPGSAAPGSTAPGSTPPGSAPHGSVPPGPDAGFGYEVQYLLDAEPEAVETLRAVLDALGDSLVVVGTGDGTPPTWNVHVHVAVDDIGPALEAGVEAGRPHRITVTRLPDGHHVTVPAAPDRPGDASPTAGHRHPAGRGAVVVAAGDGLTAMFAAEGATVVGHNPSTAEILAAITATGAGSVVLLPNDGNTVAVASAAAREAAGSGVQASVVPTRSPVQALAALAVRDAQRPFADDVIAMAEAAGACRYGEVCTARREALTMAGRCRPGDLLGLVDSEVHVIGGGLAEVCRRLLDRMLGGGGELVTLVLGADAPPGLEPALRTHLTTTWPYVELQCYAGGQPRYHLLVGVE